MPSEAEDEVAKLDELVDTLHGKELTQRFTLRRVGSAHRFEFFPSGDPANQMFAAEGNAEHVHGEAEGRGDSSPCRFVFCYDVLIDEVWWCVWGRRVEGTTL